MARSLNAQLRAAMLSQRRDPAWIIEVWDLRSTSALASPTRINDVVLRNVGSSVFIPEIAGPRDFTSDVLEARIIETAGDYADQGITSTAIELTVIDARGLLDPVSNPPTISDPEADGRWLRQGNVIVIREGDRRESDSAFWPITFTGKIQGQPGQSRNRTSGRSELKVKANSREVDYLRRVSTSQNFTQGTAYSSMVDTIARVDMGLDPDELDLSTVGGGRFTQFLSTQFVEESPLTSIAKILFPDGFMPRFQGDGTLGVANGIITKGAARVYDDAGLFLSIDRPLLEFNGINSISIIGLSPLLSQIIQGVQELARASITTGFFSDDATIDVAWSEDRTQQAIGARLQVLASIGDGPFSFGGESFSTFPQSDGGSVAGQIEVDGALSKGLALVGLLFGAFIAAALIPDIAPPFGGPTFPIGRKVQAAIGQIIMLTLGQQGRGDYRIIGRPYEYVFEQIIAVARVSGLRSEDRQEKVIENHLVNSQADADAIAERVLRRARAKQNARQIRMIHDLALEPDDIFELDGSRYMIETISRVLKRQQGPIEATVGAFEVTTGVRP